MNAEAWSTYWVGIAMGVFSGLAIGYVLWRLPAQFNKPSRQERKRLEEEQVTQWHEKLLATPMRTLEEIAEDREPEWVRPVLALGMRREAYAPPPPKIPYSGPPWWKVKDYFAWNMGDLLNHWSIDVHQQDSSRHRLL